MAKQDSPSESAKPKLASDLPKELIEKKIQEWLENNVVRDFKGKVGFASFHYGSHVILRLMLHQKTHLIIPTYTEHGTPS
jgi:hypothetical protein